jgi:hypothetical protein
LLVQIVLVSGLDTATALEQLAAHLGGRVN